MTTLAKLAAEIAELRVENAQLRADNAALRREVTQLTKQLGEAQRALEEARRASKRPAAPFAKGPPQAAPKKPGRKRGHRASQRPVPTQVDVEQEAPLPADCPHCGGELVEERVADQYQVDVPPVQPVVTKFRVHIGHCRDCQQRVQGRHPAQTSDALGAAAVQLGPVLLGLAAEAKMELGLSYGKLQRWFARVVGVKASPGAYARANQRLARCHGPVYAKLLEIMRHSPRVGGDETGWRCGGHTAYLWVFTTQAVTVYVIDAHRDHAVLERVLGREFAGILHCDCFAAYDAVPYRQQKCLQHIVRRCDEFAADHTGRVVQFSRQVAQLLRGAIHLLHRYQAQQISAAGYRIACGRLEAALDRLLGKALSNPDNVRLAKMLRKHRQQLFVFLYEDGVAPTNAAAEREIRPAVVTRKLSAGNRTPAGSHAQEVLSTVMRTCAKQNKDFIALTVARLRQPNALLPTWLTRLFVTTQHTTTPVPP